MQTAIRREVENAINEIMTSGAHEDPDGQPLREIIGAAIRNAVADATAFYRADPNIVVKYAYSFHNGMVAAFDQSDLQIPALQRYTLVELMNLMLQQKARLVELQDGLDTLIGEYAAACEQFGKYDDETSEARVKEASAKIDVILKGGD